MGCRYELIAKREGGVDALNQMMDWCEAMHKKHNDSGMGYDWNGAYNIALRGFEAKIQSLIDELEC